LIALLAAPLQGPALARHHGYSGRLGWRLGGHGRYGGVSPWWVPPIS